MQTANKSPSPDTEGFHQPAEWENHESCWLAWPSHGDLWLDGLPAAQAEFTGLCKAIADVGPDRVARGEPLQILVPTPEARAQAEKALQGLPVRFHSVPFGDIWVRDTGCLFLTSSPKSGGDRQGRSQGHSQDHSKIASVRFGFNGWGGKYILPFDSEVSARMSSLSSTRSFSFPWILEGGSIDVDGEGTCLTTRQCLLNPNRNSGMPQKEIEEGLKQSLGITQVLWLKDGLLNDHTDGHIDTLARFVAPGVVACMKAMNPSEDPNHQIYEEIARDLAGFKDAQGRSLRVVRVPSPGKLIDEDGRILPASYMNFYIGNTVVVVPTYGTPFDQEAVRAIASLFPGRKTVGSSALAILSGGGAFHCITQQQPSGRIAP